MPAEDSGAVALSPQVSAQCERHRQQRAAGHALDGAANHQHIQIGGQRRDHRPDQEGGQADLQKQLAAEPVGCPAQQRHRRDVAQQIPGDDRGDALQMVDRDADGADDVAHDRDHDIGVEGTEEYGQAAGADRDAAPRVMRCRHAGDRGLGDLHRRVPVRQRHLDRVARALLQLGLHQLVVTVFLDPHGRGHGCVAFSCGARPFTASAETVPVILMVLCPLIVSRDSAFGLLRLVSTLARPVSGLRIEDGS